MFTINNEKFAAAADRNKSQMKWWMILLRKYISPETTRTYDSHFVQQQYQSQISGEMGPIAAAYMITWYLDWSMKEDTIAILSMFAGYLEYNYRFCKLTSFVFLTCVCQLRRYYVVVVQRPFFSVLLCKYPYLRTFLFQRQISYHFFLTCMI